MRFPQRRILLLCFILTLTQIEAVTIYLEKVVLLDESCITLGKIASVTGASSVVENRLKNLKVFEFSGRLMLLPVREVQKAIKSSASWIPEQVVLIGGRIAIIPHVYKKDFWFLKQLMQFLNDSEANHHGRIEIEVVSYPDLRFLTSNTKGDIHIEFNLTDFTSKQDHLSGMAHISFRQTESKNKDVFTLFVHQYIPIAYTRKDLIPNQVLSEQALVFYEKDISIIREKFILEGDDPKLYRTRTSLHEGSIVDRRMLTKNYIVRNGESINISFICPGLKVTVAGKACGTGCAGDIIEVMSGESRKKYTARIISRREVYIENP